MPFLLAINVLLVELAVAQRGPLMSWIALAAPLLTLTAALCVESSFGANLRFPDRFADLVSGTPLYATAIAVVLVYGWCTLRRLRHAADALSLALLLLAVMTPNTSSWATMTPATPHVLPLCLLAVVQCAIAARHHDAVRYVCAAACGCLALAMQLGAAPVGGDDLLVPLHVFLACSLLIGAVVRNRSGRLVQHVAAVLIFAAAAELIVFGPRVLTASATLSSAMATVYPPLAIAMALLYGRVMRNESHFAAAAAVAVLWLTDGAYYVYHRLRETMAGFDYLLLGIAAFVVAVVISLSKISKLRQWLRVRRRRRRQRVM